MSQISRRSVAKGVAWSVPAVAVASATPAFASSSTAAYFDCPTTNSLGQVTAGISAAATNTYNGVNGTTFGITIDSSNIASVPIHYPDGSVKQSTGAYFIPGCGATTCAPDVKGGFTLPTGNTVIAYDAAGSVHSGQVRAATPTGCSPSLNGAFDGTWQIATDIAYTANTCGAGAANRLAQISIPVTLLYTANGSSEVVGSSGGNGAGCCIYLNVQYPTSGGCTGTQDSVITSWSYSAMAAPQGVAPVISSAGNAYTPVGGTITVKGSNFVNVQQVLYNGVPAQFTVGNKNQLTFIVPAGSGIWGTSYAVYVITSAGASNPMGLMHG